MKNNNNPTKIIKIIKNSSMSNTFLYQEYNEILSKNGRKCNVTFLISKKNMPKIDKFCHFKISHLHRNQAQRY